MFYSDFFFQLIEVSVLVFMYFTVLFPDKYTQLNSALFSLNGCTGYMLQPEVMRSDNFDPLQENKKVKYIIDVKVGLNTQNSITVSEMSDF